MCITIELWSSFGKLSKGITPFCVFFFFIDLVLVTALLTRSVFYLRGPAARRLRLRVDADVSLGVFLAEDLPEGNIET